MLKKKEAPWLQRLGGQSVNRRGESWPTYIAPIPVISQGRLLSQALIQALIQALVGAGVTARPDLCASRSSSEPGV